LLFLVLFGNLGWFMFCVPIIKTRQKGISILLLLIYECFVNFLHLTQTLINYIIYLFDLKNDGSLRGIYSYYNEFCTESLILVATLFHYAHILVLNGISLSFYDMLILFCIYVYMRMVFNILYTRITAYKNYTKLLEYMNNNYKEVDKDEIDHDNNLCAICRQEMFKGRKLPCGHIFHYSCLRSWLEQQDCCPFCIKPLLTEVNEQHEHQRENNNDNTQGDPLFQFGGGWLPSVSVELINNTELQDKIKEIKSIFPNIADDIIKQTIMRIGTIEGTIEFLSNNSNVTLQPNDNKKKIIEEDLPKFTDKFGETSEERKLSLEKRKAQMLELARRKNMHKKNL